MFGFSPSKSLAESPSQRCNSAVPGFGIEQFQSVDPDLFLPHTRDRRGRFAKGSSGNSRGRPRGIPNPKRRVPDLVARPLGAQALLDLIDRKPYLLRPLAAQLLPPPLSFGDPAARLGLDLRSLRTVGGVTRVFAAVLAAIAGGGITPREGARIARRVRAQLRTTAAPRGRNGG
jgi:hypothetical protein